MANRSNQSAPPPARYGLSRYWEATQEPLYSLLFLLPWVLVYEFLAAMVRPQGGLTRELVAHSLLTNLFGWFGVTSRLLPGAVLLGTLLVWHLWSRRRWQISLTYLPLMLTECVLLTVPLFVLLRVLLTAQTGVPTSLASDLINAIGAGLFEELVFRLYLITGLIFLLGKVVRLSAGWSAALAIILATLGFAISHFDPIGQEPFAWIVFFQFIVAGVYLSLVFVGRGLGIAAGCHACYDLFVVLSQHGS